MRIYISTRGDAHGIEQAKALAAKLVARGHIISFPWWEAVETERAKGNTSDDSLSPAERRHHGSLDFGGVRTADLSVYLEPHEKSEGAAWELGASWMARSIFGLPYVTVIGQRRAFIFSELCDLRMETVDQLIERLPMIAKEVDERRAADGRR